MRNLLRPVYIDFNFRTFYDHQTFHMFTLNERKALFFKSNRNWTVKVGVEQQDLGSGMRICQREPLLVTSPHTWSYNHIFKQSNFQVSLVSPRNSFPFVFSDQITHLSILDCSDLNRSEDGR